MTTSVLLTATVLAAALALRLFPSIQASYNATLVPVPISHRSRNKT